MARTSFGIQSRTPRCEWVLAVPGLLALFISIASPGWSAVPGNPTINVPICTNPAPQLFPKSAPDGSGGMIVAWTDARNNSGDINSGNNDVYVHHILASGAADPTWPEDGLAVCTAAGYQSIGGVVSDGAGGAILTWRDVRSIQADNYAQHVLASGTVDPAWPVNGQNLTPGTTFFRDYPQIAPDGAGGGIVVWDQSNAGNADIYYAHVQGSGVVDPPSPAEGRALCTAPDTQRLPMIVPDGSGGAIVTWEDFRNGSPNLDIYAHHVLASGAVDPTWPVNGLAVCSNLSRQTSPILASDGAGGAIVNWRDSRASTDDVYAQHVLASGAVDGAWPADGQAICTANGSQVPAGILPDGTGGAIMVWSDTRTSAPGPGTYAQHVLASGVVDGGWPVNGRALVSADASPGNTEPNFNIASDGSGGAIVALVEGAGSDVYAQHLMASGVVDPAWSAVGAAICTAPNIKSRVNIVASGAGGALLAWVDTRDGFANSDIYSQLVDASGTLGPLPAEIITSSAGAGGTISPSGAVFVWDGSDQSFTITPSACTSIADVVVDGSSVGAVSTYTFTDVLTGHTITALFTPCLAGDLVGRVTADCPVSGTPLLGATVDAFAVGSGDLLGTGVTNANGQYSIPGIPAINYIVSLVTPLGYTTSAADVSTTVPAGGTATVNFGLSCITPSGNPSSSGFWKHQFGVATGGTGNAQFDAATLCGYLDVVEQHFNDNALNQVAVYDAPDGATCPQKLDIAKNLLNLGGSPAAIDKARQQLLSLLLNVAANNLGLTNIISKDGATVSQAVTYCDQLIDNPSGDRALAAAIAEKVNAGQKVNAGVIPLSTAQIAYERRMALQTFRVTQNPGPQMRAFQFAMGEPGVVRLRVFDIAGRQVAELVNGTLEAGAHVVTWDGVTTGGDHLKNGVYFARLETEGGVKTLKVTQLTR